LKAKRKQFIIVEKHIVQSELEKLSKANLIQEKQFENIRFIDKLAILKDSLRDFLINNCKVYSNSTLLKENSTNILNPACLRQAGTKENNEKTKNIQQVDTYRYFKT